MADFGVTAQGFKLKRLADIKTEIENDLKDKLGNNINLLPEEVLGQLIGVFSEREALLWELAQAVYFSQYPASSEDTNLDNVAAVTGAERKTPIASTISGQLLWGTIGTVIPLGSIISVENSPSTRFKTDSDVTLVAGTDEIQKITFGADPDSGSFKLSFQGQTTATIAHDDTVGDVKSKLEALSTIGVGNVSVSGSIDATGLSITFLNPGPTGLGLRDNVDLVVSDNTLLDGATAVSATQSTPTPGVPQGSTNMTAETTGATVANAETANVIETPVSGWDSTENPLDATVGRGEESDPDFRLRRDQEIADPGAATPPAVFADISEINDVIAVVVFFNNTDIIDADGRPPHSVDVVVQGGDEQTIADELFKTVGGGITFFGDIEKDVIDESDGFTHKVKFSRPAELEIHLEVDLSVNTDLFPADGLVQVENAILAYGNALAIGQDVVVFGSDPSLSCSFKDIPGIEDFVIRVGTAASPTLDDNIDVDRKEIADFDSTRITVATV